MRILLIAHFCDEVGLGGNNRFNYLASFLVEQGHQVELITSGFSHTTKQPKQVQPGEVIDFRLTYVDEPSYSRNVSLRRFWAHRVMARALATELNARESDSEVADLIYCAVPSLAVADVASQYAQTIQKPFVIDVQDLWPDAFFMVGPLRRFALLFSPLEAQARRIYARADAVVAVSKRYAKRALTASERHRPNHVVYLGTDLERFDQHALSVERAADVGQVADAGTARATVEFVYLGTLGHSYDLKTAIRAFNRAQQTLAEQQSNLTLRMTVIGDGPLLAEFKAYAQQLGVTVEFVGRLPYTQMVQRLVVCDVALNVIRKGAAQSIINKHADYAAAGLPVLSTQECAEYRELLCTFEAGMHCADENALATAMVELVHNLPLRRRLAQGSRNMAETLFDRRATYPQLIALLEATQQQYGETLA